MEQTDRCAEPAKSLTLEQAKERMRQAISPMAEIEILPLDKAFGRVLAQSLQAPMDLPPFANSAMDGYALRHEDVSRDPSAKLIAIGTSYAGMPFTATVGSGQCVRIFTGAAMPEGADTVAMQEDAIIGDGGISLSRRISAGANVRPAGDEMRRGSVLLVKGKRLGPSELGLLASAGIVAVPVMRKLRVAFFSTGDELCPVGETLEYGQIHDSNRHILGALLEHPAIEAIDLGLVRDESEAVKQALLEASSRADFILTSGGVSVGNADFVTGALAELGEVNFWKVAIKPGKPFAFGRIGGAWFFGLPGNPVAVMVTFLQLVRPTLMHAMGVRVEEPVRLKATSLSRLKKPPGRMEFQRGVLTADGKGGLSVCACPGQGSHQLSSMSQANCFIVLPAENSGVEPGDSVYIEPFFPAW